MANSWKFAAVKAITDKIDDLIVMEYQKLFPTNN
jgi:hypothetical protein